MSDEKPRTMRGSDDDYCATYPADGHFYVGHSVDAEPIGFVDRCQFCGHISSRALRERLDTESTSAALARVTAERDELAEQLEKTRTLHRIEWTRERDECVRLRERLTKVAAERDGLASLAAELTDERDHARSERDALKALYADATKRATIVARDGGRDCVACDGEVRRGEAYTFDVEADELQHVHCPDPNTITRRAAGEPLEEGKAPHA